MAKNKTFNLLGTLVALSFVAACSGSSSFILGIDDDPLPPGTSSSGGGGSSGGTSGGSSGGSSGGGLTSITDGPFIQTTNAKVDMVWMIDDSGSMSDEQTLLANNAAAFMGQLENASVDFRLIVIRSGAGEDSRLRSQCTVELGQPSSGDGIITNATANKFASCVENVPSSGGSEEGIEAARRALDPDYVNGPLNPTFLRSEAPLHVVFVSDEEDNFRHQNARVGDTYGADTVTQELLDEYLASLTTHLSDYGRTPDGREAYFPTLRKHLDFFVGLKGGNASKFKAHAIVYKDLTGTPCTPTMTGYEEVGQRYLDFAALTHGTESDMCDSWGETLETIGLEASGLNRCFALSQIPADPADIVAKINGVVQPASEVEYRAFGNRICFKNYPAVPAVGDAVTIEYAYYE